jgi:hypothetical protein
MKTPCHVHRVISRVPAVGESPYTIADTEYEGAPLVVVIPAKRWIDTLDCGCEVAAVGGKNLHFRWDLYFRAGRRVEAFEPLTHLRPSNRQCDRHPAPAARRWNLFSKALRARAKERGLPYP